MLTLEKITTAIKDLPTEFSLDQLVDRLRRLEQQLELQNPVEPAKSPAAEYEPTRYTSPEALALYAKFPASPSLRALRGIAAGLPPELAQRSAKEWEAARIEEKYGL